MKDPAKQMKELQRGCDEILSEKELMEKLSRGKPLTIKAGFDPTAPDIHLGHTVIMQKMAQFQKMGHNVVFLIGDFTGLVGDPSGKSKTRPQLTREEVAKNAETYKAQIFRLLDPEKTEIRFNSEWLEKMTAFDFIRLASHANVARMLEREDFNNRYKTGQSISLHEFIYPLLQAHDSVMLKADVELGGRDQKFNLLLGRELMRDNQMSPQVCITLPLLEGLDGVQKMSKSLNNYVGIGEAPDIMYGKIMSIPDTLLRKYYDLLSDENLSDLENRFSLMERGHTNPKFAKSDLAIEIVTKYHTKELAEKAKENFESQFARKELPKDIPEFQYSWTGRDIWIPKLLHEIQFAASTSEGKRLVAQGGVRINEKALEGEHFEPEPGNSFILQCGKRKWAKITYRR